MRTEYEKRFTSTKIKLLHNLDRLQEIKDGKFRPISIQLAPTDKCNLDCVFCSVKKREGNELSFEEVCIAITELTRMGAKTIEITGGGDPTLYSFINELIEFSTNLGLKVGLITNGILLNKNISYFLLEKLSWIRISLNSLDYVKELNVNIPKGPIIGFSYVWNESSDLNKIRKLLEYKERYDASYVRIVPDCRDVKFIEEYRKEIQPKIQDKLGSGFFFQEKDYTPPKRCWIGYLKPFINSDGYLYRCSANPLIELKFNSKFRIGKIEEIKDIWDNIKPFSTEHCGECFFKEHNELIEEIICKIEHEDFI